MGDNRSREASTIKKLSKELRDKVRSGCNIVSVEQCVQELVYNAIDAGATKIYVGINMKHFKVEVEDDGCGLGRADLELVGRRYVTSKWTSPDDLRRLNYYGYRGEALASIISVSKSVKLLTRPRKGGYVSAYRLWFWGGKISDTGVEELSESKRSPGFTITVEGLLDNQPVRQNRLDRSAQLTDVRMALERIALINPNISIELRNELNMSPILKYNPCFSHADAFDQLFSTKKKDAFCFESENHLQDGIMLSASIGKLMYRQKCFQYVFVNKRCVEMRNRIHKVMNDLLSKLLTNVKGGSGKDKDKSSEKLFPVFILNVSCALEKYCPQMDSKYGVEFFEWDSCVRGIEGLILKFQSRVFPSSSATRDFGVIQTLKSDKKNQSTLKEALSKSVKHSDPFLGKTSFGQDISTRDVKNALHSRPAIRLAAPPPHELSTYESDRSSDDSRDSSKRKRKRKPKAHSPTRAAKLLDSDDDSNDEEEGLSTTYSDLVASPSMMMQNKLVPLPRAKKTTAKHTVYNVRRRSPKNTGVGKKIELVRGGIGAPRPRKDIIVAKKPVPILNKDVFSKFPPWSKKVKVTSPFSRAGNKRKLDFLPDLGSGPIVQKKPKYGDLMYKTAEKTRGRNASIRHLIPVPRTQRGWISPDGPGVNRKLREKGVEVDTPNGRDWKLRRYLSDSQNGNQAKKDILSDILSDEDDISTPNSKPLRKFNQSQQDCCHSDSSSITGVSSKSLSISLKNRFSADSARSGLMSSRQEGQSCDKELPKDRNRNDDSEEEADGIIAALVGSGEKFVAAKNIHLAADIASVLQPSLRAADAARKRISEKKETEKYDTLKRQFKDANTTTVDLKPPSLVLREPVFVTTNAPAPAAIGAHLPRPVANIVAETPDPFGINNAIKQSHYVAPPFPNRNRWSEQPPTNLFRPSSASSSSFPFSGFPPVQPAHQYQSLPLVQPTVSNRSKRYQPAVFQNWVDPTQLSDFHVMPRPKSPSCCQIRNANVVEERSSYFQQPHQPLTNIDTSGRVNVMQQPNPFFPRFEFGRCADKEFGSESEYFAPSPFPCVTEGNESQHQNSIAIGLKAAEPTRQLCPRDDSSFQEAPDTPLIEALMKPPVFSDCTFSPYFTPPSEQDEEDNESPTTTTNDRIRRSQESVVIKEVTPSTNDEEMNLITDNKKISEAEEDNDDDWGLWEVDVVSDANGQDWLKTLDEGKTVFINLSNGDLSYDMVNIVKWNRTTAGSLTKDRGRNWLRRYFPKGYDQLWKRDVGSYKPQINGNIAASTNHLSEKVKEFIVKSVEDPGEVFDKWRVDSRVAAGNHGFQPTTLVNTTSEYFGGPAEDILVTSLNGNGDSKVYNKIMSKPLRFKKEDLLKLKVISQWDRKFIVAKLTVDDFDESKEGVKGPKDVLVALDQHAVHERIRLERLVNELYEVDRETGQKGLVRVRIQPSFELNLMESEVRVLNSYPESFRRIGLNIDVVSCTTVKITSAPVCIVKKAMMEQSPTEHTLALSKMLSDLIQEEIRKVQDTKTIIAAAVPKTIFNILCSQACHGAIKFGDELELSVCEAMISALQQCRTPFQCAHGRPSIIPLIELSSLLRGGLDSFNRAQKCHLWREPKRPSSSSSDTLTQSKPSIYFQG